MRILFFLCFLVTIQGFPQLTPAKQHALNDCVEYANKSAAEVTSVVKSIIDYYPGIHRKNTWGVRYTCPVQLEDYYLTKALTDSKVLGVAASAVNLKVKALRASAEKIDERCKALDTYHKLEDYKQDNFAKAESIIREFQVLLLEYRQKQKELSDELESSYKKMVVYSDNNAYYKTDRLMSQQILKERSLIDSWSFNLKEDVPTGWPVDKLAQSIAETDKQLKNFYAYKPDLQYPTSSMYGSFKSSLSSILEVKRSALDDYNTEAKKSDRHSNEVYLDLINYFNGTLITDFNTYVQYAEANNYHGLKIIQYVPVFEIRTAAKTETAEVKPFSDIPHKSFALTPTKTVIQKSVFESLILYIEFINESLRQTGYLQLVVRNLNSDAAYYKDLTSYKGKGGMQYDYKTYQLPLSLYQQATAPNKLPAAVAKSLNEQAEVLLNIMKEMDQQSAWLETETEQKNYEKDNLKKVYETLERYRVLFDAFDSKKEQLYSDVRKVYESYTIANPGSSWYVSGKALQDLTDLDHGALFQAKAYYKGDAKITSISTEKIDQTLRDVISKEYTNMKGIQKIGRNNGLCPYTPYEDLPQSSKYLREKLDKLKPATGSGYNHPYHDMVYQYNDVVDELNKFSELSKEVYLLKTVKQPELFFVEYPDKKQQPKEEKEDVQKPVVDVVKETEKPVANDATVIPIPPQPAQIKTQHDTVYIEKRDTIYLAEHDTNLRSMEGYATNNMILLLDVSGSMNAPEKLPLLKKSVLDLLQMMRAEDEVSIVVYSGKAKILLEPTSFKDEQRIKSVIEKLKSEGKTDGNAGLKLAYKVADENYVRGGNNRIILATDGEFPISEEMFGLVKKSSGEDIFISVFNFGQGSASVKNLEKLSTMGKGNYEHITKENMELKLIREAKSKRTK